MIIIVKERYLINDIIKRRKLCKYIINIIKIIKIIKLDDIYN